MTSLTQTEIRLLRTAINLLPASVRPSDRPAYRALYAKLAEMAADASTSSGDDVTVTVPLAAGRYRLTAHREYVITYLFGDQRYQREAQGSFLGVDHGGNLLFNMRPAALTETFPPSAITVITDIGPSCGREHPSRYMNRRAAA